MNQLSQNVSNQPTSLAPHQVNPVGPVSLLPKVDILEILHALRRRLWIVVLCAVILCALMAVYITTRPVLFASYGSVHVKTEAPQVFDIKPIAQEESRDLEQMRTVADGLRSSTVLLGLVEKYNLGEDSDFAPVGAKQQTLFEIMQKRVRVELRRGTRLIDISVEDTDPERAARMVEDLVKEYERGKDLGHSNLIARVSTGLENEEVRLRKKMEESESLLNEFRAANPLPGLLSNGGKVTATSEVDMMNREHIESKTERLRLQSEYEAFQKLDTDDTDALAGLAEGEHAAMIIEIGRELAAKEVEFGIIKKRYLHKHPVYVEAANEIEGLKSNLAKVSKTAGEVLKKRYDLAVEHENRLRETLGLAKGEAVGEESVRGAFAKLSRQAQIDRELHASVAKRLRETQIGSSWSGSFLRWEDRPLVADFPVKPRKKLLLAASLVMGGALGLVFALIAELLDRRVRESAAVERVVGVPVLASIPHFTPQALQDLGTLPDSGTSQARPMQLSNFVFPPEQVAAGKSTMLFTSAFKNDGKSVSAVKCAKTLARQGYRTLLIDADFHDEGLSRGYAQKFRDKRHGLAAYLMGEVKADDSFYQTSCSGLWFAPTGAVGGDTSELLSKPDFKILLESLTAMFDRIVIDASSVVDDSDVQSIVRHVDATCLVVRKNAGRYRDIKEASEVLRSAGGHLVGFVWNEVDQSATAGMGPEVAPLKETSSQSGDMPSSSMSHLAMD